MRIRRLTSDDFGLHNRIIRKEPALVLGINLLKKITFEQSNVLASAIKHCFETLGEDLIDALASEHIKTVFETTDDIEAALIDLSTSFNINLDKFKAVTSGKSFRYLMRLKDTEHFIFKIVIDNETLSNVELTKRIIFDHMKYLVRLVKSVKGNLQRLAIEYVNSPN